MRIDRLDNMKRGWFVGNFEPSVYKTDKCEVAIKHYNSGVYEESHIHYYADEVSVILSGIVEMNGQRFESGDIITINKGESCDFYCIEDAVTVVYKSESQLGDKKILNTI